MDEREVAPLSPVHLKVIQAVHLIRYGVLAKVIGHFFAKVNGHRRKDKNKCAVAYGRGSFAAGS